MGGPRLREAVESLRSRPQEVEGVSMQLDGNTIIRDGKAARMLKCGVQQCHFMCDNEVTLWCFRPQTTIMAVEFDGGVVMGADSRTTTG